MFQRNVVGKIKTHILGSLIFFRKFCLLSDNVAKYCRAGEATDGNMGHAYYLLDTEVYTYTLRVCNIYCFSSTTKVGRTRLFVTLYLHWLSCLHLLVPIRSGARTFSEHINTPSFSAHKDLSLTLWKITFL